MLRGGEACRCHVHGMRRGHRRDPSRGGGRRVSRQLVRARITGCGAASIWWPRGLRRCLNLVAKGCCGTASIWWPRGDAALPESDGHRGLRRCLDLVAQGGLLRQRGRARLRAAALARSGGPRVLGCRRGRAHAQLLGFHGRCEFRAALASSGRARRIPVPGIGSRGVAVPQVLVTCSSTSELRLVCGSTGWDCFVVANCSTVAPAAPCRGCQLTHCIRTVIVSLHCPPTFQSPRHLADVALALSAAEVEKSEVPKPVPRTGARAPDRCDATHLPDTLQTSVYVCH